jgi:hypothetical protein
MNVLKEMFLQDTRLRMQLFVIFCTSAYILLLYFHDKWKNRKRGE